MRTILRFAVLLFAFFHGLAARAATAGAPSLDELAIVRNGKTEAIVVRSANAGKGERAAADDLVHYVAVMTGATMPIADTAEAIAHATASGRPLLVVGEEALSARPDLKKKLDSILKPNPLIRTDGVALLRDGNRVYIAGNHDESHYFATAELLRRWGVRWFMPGEFGECVPDDGNLFVGALDYVYSSPFEVRSYWVSWLGDDAGRETFQKRNMFTDRNLAPPYGHALQSYTKDLGRDEFHIPLTAPRTAEQIATAVAPLYETDKSFSLSIADGVYDPPDEDDRRLMRLQWDKYFLTWSVTDPILILYQNIARILRIMSPNSASKVGFLIYSNMTLPPTLPTPVDPMFFGLLAPIDFDPIHAMDDPRSPNKQELRTIMEKWARILDRRLVIYDYDQSMLVWRDLPNPSHMAVARDMKIYRDAGILGLDTESRNALATTFLNLYMRGRLMWNPDEDPQALLDDFYPRFFGPAAASMKAYWEAIFRVWSETLVTEHEYFIAQSLYTPKLIDELGRDLEAAEAALAPVRDQGATLRRNDRFYLERLQFVRLGYEVLRNYMAMVRSAASDGDYAAAVEAGERGLKARDDLTAMNKAFTTTRLEESYAFWPGEVAQYRELLSLFDGKKGELIIKLPLEWAFHRDPHGEGEKRGFASAPVDLSYWRAHGGDYNIETRKDYPDEWEMVRTDLYVQAQGVRFLDQHNYVGDIWYRTKLDLSAAQAGTATRLMFPGLFHACDLFIAGRKVAERAQRPLWWHNDYRFQWDVPLEGALRADENDIALRCHIPGHMGGMFRRPFLYSAQTVH